MSLRKDSPSSRSGGEIYPWNLRLWRQLLERRQRLPHGILLSGPQGTGKRMLGMALAHYLSCLAPEPEQACGECRSCQLFASGTLPDFHLLSSEYERELTDEVTLFYRYAGRYLEPEEERRKRTKPRRVISIDRIRDLIVGFSSHAHTARQKVAMLSPAESMTLSAANALLKLLEEPPEDSVLILVSSVPSRLPATIRSRCMTVNVPLPAAEEALGWLHQRLPAAQGELALSLAGGSPLAAASLAESGFVARHEELLLTFERLLAGSADPVATAASWQKEDFPTLLLWLQRVVADAIRRASGVQAQTRSTLQPASAGAIGGLRRLYEGYDSIGRLRQMAQDQINPQLALEELLLCLQMDRSITR